MDLSAEHYREEAQLCRALAGIMLSAAPKEHMLDMARQYDELAQKAEKQGRSAVLIEGSALTASGLAVHSA